MTRHRRLRIATALVLAGLAFFLYGQFRTIDENVGFRLSTTFRSLCLLGFFLSIAWVPLLVRQLSGFRATRTLRLVIYSLIVGSLLSEGWIVFDEARFKSEAAASPDIYSRGRAWPNRGTALVYIPHRGIHATD